MSYYRNLVKDMDDSQKLELVTMLIDSIKPVSTAPLADIPTDEEFADMDKELYTPEEAYELTMEEMLEGYPYKRYTKAELNAMLDEAEADIAAGKVIDDDDLRREDEEEYERELAEEQKLQLEAV